MEAASSPMEQPEHARTTGDARIHIVTDSFASFASTSALRDLPITIVPNKITLAGKQYREGVDIGAEEALRLIGQQPATLIINPPSVADYEQVYSRLVRDHTTILSIHASREMFLSWANARAAASQLLGQCHIEVVDSRTLGAAQGLLVSRALAAVRDGQPTADVIRFVRGATERLYSVYFTEAMEVLLKQNILEPSHAILGSMLGVKPVLTVENGRLNAMEKVRTRSQAVERLVEFAVEFTDMDEGFIVQPRLGNTEAVRMLQERLAVEFPQRTFGHVVYSPSLAALIGVDALGLVILEHEFTDPANGSGTLDEIDDEYNL